MFATATIPLVANRWVPFIDWIAVEAIDLTGATFTMQVRDRWNGGAVRADLGTVATLAEEGLKLEVSTVDGLVTSKVNIRINETTMEAMPLASDPDGPTALVYDLHCNPVGGQKFVMARGPFTVVEGSTE